MSTPLTLITSLFAVYKTLIIEFDMGFTYVDRGLHFKVTLHLGQVKDPCYIYFSCLGPDRDPTETGSEKKLLFNDPLLHLFSNESETGNIPKRDEFAPLTSIEVSGSHSLPYASVD